MNRRLYDAIGKSGKQKGIAGPFPTAVAFINQPCDATARQATYHVSHHGRWNLFQADAEVQGIEPGRQKSAQQHHAFPYSEPFVFYAHGMCK